MRYRLLAFTVIGLIMVNIADAHSFQQGAIDIGHLSTSPAPIGGKLEITGPILNTGKVPDQLTGVSSDAADAAVIEDDSTGTTYNVDKTELVPSQPLTLKPHGVHILLSGLKQAQPSGNSVPLTLHFAHAGDAQVTAVVQ